MSNKENPNHFTSALQVDDPQIIDTYHGLSASGGQVDLESFWILQDIKDQLPPSGIDYKQVQIEAYRDEIVDYTPLLKLTAGMLDGLEAVNEETNHVFVQFRHARVLAQLGIPFTILAPSRESRVSESLDSQPNSEDFELDPADDFDHHRNNPDNTGHCSQPEILFTAPVKRRHPKPLFDRVRRDVRSRRRLRAAV